MQNAQIKRLFVHLILMKFPKLNFIKWECGWVFPSKFSSLCWTARHCHLVNLLKSTYWFHQWQLNVSLSPLNIQHKGQIKVHFLTVNVLSYHIEQLFLLHTQQNSHALHGSASLCGITSNCAVTLVVHWEWGYFKKRTAYSGVIASRGHLIITLNNHFSYIHSKILKIYMAYFLNFPANCKLE